MTLKSDHWPLTNDKMNRLFRTLTAFFIFSLLVILLLKSTSIVASTPLSFDGSLNALGAHSLLNSENNNYRGIDFFDPRIQTGITVTLPTALLFSVFGESFEIGLIPNFLYLIGFVIGIIYYYKINLGLDNEYILVALLLFMLTPQLFTVGFGLYGELPALTFFLYSIIMVAVYKKKEAESYIFVSGLLVGLSYLTKTVLLIGLGGYALIFAFHLLDHNQSIRKNLRLAVKFVLGFAVPVIFLEVCKWGYMGTHTYLEWWKSMSLSISQQAGITEGFTDTPGIISKFLTHLSLLSGFLHLSQILIALLLFIVAFTLAKVFFTNHRNKQHSKDYSRNSVPFDFCVILTVILIYFVWWLLITPTQKAWYRRIFNAILLLELSLPVMFAFFKRDLQSIKSFWREITSHKFDVINKSAFLLFFIVAIAFSLKQDAFNISFSNTNLKKAYLLGGAFVQTLPSSAKVYGTGWWQAPNLAFSAQRDIFDINPEIETLALQPKLEAFLAEDHNAINIAHTTIQQVLDHFDSTVIFNNEYLRIYELSNLSP